LASIAVLACYLCQAEGIEDAANAANGRAGQDDPARRRSAVEAVGRWVVDHYSDKQSAADGVLDVTKSPYSADPTGKRDSTSAIQHAMKDARDARLVTFLPGGTYRVSDTITCIQGAVTPDHWPFGQSASPATQTTAGESGYNYQSDYFPCVLMGSREVRRSTIILAPRAPGFGDPQKPKPVIHFWARSEDEEPGAMKALIEGADARNISVHSLKAEGIYTVLWINGCRDIRISGFGGIDNSEDFLLANFNPELIEVPAHLEKLDFNTYWFGALGIPSDPRKWFLIAGTASQTQVSLHGVEQVALLQTLPSANCP
jgi:hypothetical protein